MVTQKTHHNLPPYIQSSYILLISASLILHVFNDVGVSENLKAFHIPTALACLLVIIFFPKKNKLQLITYGLATIAVLSSALSAYEGAIMRGISMGLVLIGCSGIVYISSTSLIKLINWLIPIALIILYHHLIISFNIYRYTGFYNDPNYLCTTLLVFEFIILENYIRTKKVLVKAALIAELILILVLAASTLSRTGIACMLLILIAYFWEIILKYRFIALVVLFAGGVYMVYDTPEVVSTAIEGFNGREDEHGNLSRATNLRFQIAMKGVNYVINHPWYWLQGSGLGATGHLERFEGSFNPNHLLDHNTITSTFSETGLIGFVLIICLLISTIKKNIKKNTTSSDRILRIFGLFSLIIFCLSINQLTYLPFWWMMYLLNNKSLIYENTSCHRLRSGR